MGLGGIIGGSILSNAIGGLASYKGSKVSAQGYRDAAHTIGEAGKEARDIQEEYYDQTRADFTPYLSAGTYGIDRYMAEAGQDFNLPEFQQPTEADMLVDPGYQFRLNQGIEATTRALSKSGQAHGGRRGIALMDYAQGLASQEYGNIYDRALKNYQLKYGRQTDYLNRIQGIMEGGRLATTSLGGIGANYAANIGSTITGTASRIGQSQIGAADARAAGYIGLGRAAGGIAESIGMLGMGGSINPSVMQGAYTGGIGGFM